MSFLFLILREVLDTNYGFDMPLFLLLVDLDLLVLLRLIWTIRRW